MTNRMNIMKDKRGAALATVIMVMLVMMILVIPVLASSLSETRQTVKYENIAQAHYTAKTGAEVLASSILDDQTFENINSLVLAGIVTDTVNANSFEARVTYLDPDYDTLLIESTGYANNESETVQLTLSRSGNFFRYAIFGDELLGLGGSSNTTIIGGDVGTNADTHSGNVTFIPPENSVQYNQEMVLDPINIGYYEINNAIFINNIVGTKEIDLHEDEESTPNGGTNDNGDPIILMRVQQVNLSGNDQVTVKGPGELHLLVEDGFNMNGTPSFRADPSTPNTKIYIDYNGTSDFNFSGHLLIDGYIYAPNATVRINGGDGSAVGSVMAKRIDVKGGNFSLTFATELSDDTIATSYKLVGWSD